MPRSNIDQALVTGLTLVANHALVSLVQDGLAAAALALVAGVDYAEHDRRWGQTTLALDLAGVAASLAVQRALPQRPRESILRSATRTGAWFTGAAAGAASIVGAYQEAQAASGRRSRFPVGLPITVAATAATEVRRRRFARRNEGLPAQSGQVDVMQSLAMSGAVTAASIGFATATRLVSDAIGDRVSRVLPGSTAFWRPVGRLATLGAIAAGVNAVARKVLSNIELKGEAFETAFDLPPPVAEVSGSSTSLVPFETLSLQGRRYVWNLVRPDVIASLMDEPAVAAPIRAYVGLASAPTEDERVELAMAELDRTGAFERSWLMFTSPTGTGYVNYAAVGALECLSRGDCATLAMQYSSRPSVLSLDRIDEGRHHADKMTAAIGARLAAMPEDRRPKFVVFGESLGAWTSQDPFEGRGTKGLQERCITHAIWIGTPYLSKWKDQVLHGDGPEIDRRLVGVFDNIGEWEQLSADERDTIRYVMITHQDDGVALFGPDTLLRAPDWLGPAETRPGRVPRGMRWMPTASFLQGLVDMKNSATVVPGQFDAVGHDYRLDLVPFFNAVLGFGEPRERVDRIVERLELQELNRARWIRSHSAAGESLAAAVAIRWMEEERAAGRDPDALLEASVRALIDQLDDSSTA
jgi:uncharacterized membrane protein